MTGLTKRYGDRTAVDHLDIELPAGVVAGFVGPNGAGKTTTMAMLLGLVRPTLGHRHRARRTRSTIPPPTCRGSARSSRAPPSTRRCPGAENLRVLAIVGGHDPDRIPALLELVGLADRGDDRYRSYSLGMKQRLGIAAALLGDPELLILDEPANGLDPQGVREMRTLVGSLAGAGRTVLVSSHDLSELEQVCDWLVLIDTGRSLYQGPTRALLDGVAGGLAVVTAGRRRPRRAPRPARRRWPPRRARRTTGWSSTSTAPTSPDVAAAVNRAAFDAGIVLGRAQPAAHDPRRPLPVDGARRMPDDQDHPRRAGPPRAAPDRRRRGDRRAGVLGRRRTHRADVGRPEHGALPTRAARPSLS